MGKIKASRRGTGDSQGTPAPANSSLADGAHEEIRIHDDPDLDSPAPPKSKVDVFSATLESSYNLPQQQQQAEGQAWHTVLNILVIFPWAVVLFLSWLVNKWQSIFRPLGAYLWWSIDQLDQRAPTLVEVILWGSSIVSLALHVITVGTNLGVIWIMWDNGHSASPIVILALYCFCHYCMGVTMFKELDMREEGGAYFTDVMTLMMRQLDVLFYDIQLCASVVHSNKMIEGMTQLMFKGYEEGRVALTTLMFNIPCCIIIGVEYGIFDNGRLVQMLKGDGDIFKLNLLHSYQDQLYAAVCFSVINSLEKILRMSLVDPWLHDKNDGFPLLYVRSHAARLPGDLVRDWLFRCRVMLSGSEGKLVLKDLYSFYTRQVKEKVYGLSDPHRAYLLRKAMHVFNTRRLYAKVPVDDAALVNKPMIQALIADGIAPGLKLAKMLADIISDSTHLHTINLASNALDDGSVIGIMEALRLNENLKLQFLDLSNNTICAQGASAIAETLGGNQSIYSLNLAGNPIKDEGAIALAEALKTNLGVARLDLSNTSIGPEGGIALANALRTNGVISHVNLSGSRIGSTGCEAIAKALRSNIAIKELDISHTSIDDKAAAALSTMLSTNKRLERLVMTHTNVTDAGAQLLCNALQGNSTLQAIDVSNNMCMDKSWQKLLNHVVKGKPQQ